MELDGLRAEVRALKRTLDVIEHNAAVVTRELVSVNEDIREELHLALELFLFCHRAAGLSSEKDGCSELAFQLSADIFAARPLRLDTIFMVYSGTMLPF